MLAPITHALPLTTIRRRRLLDVPGRILVRKGQPVLPEDVIAEADHPSNHQLLDVARVLGVTPQVAEQVLQRTSGDQVGEGDLVAGPVGWPKRVVRATQAGEIILIRKGQVLIRTTSQPLQLKAALPGIISGIIDDRGVEITCSGALIQGVWGNGLSGNGSLRILLSKPEDVLTAERFDEGLRGTIVLAGYCGEENGLQKAADIPVSGLVLASMSATLVPLAESLPFPILILEGFGLHPMNMPAYKLLASNEGRETALLADKRQRYGNARPEIVIPLPVTDAPAAPRDATLFSPNQRVRVLRAPYSAQVGSLIGVLPGMEIFPSGIRARSASVRLDNGQQVVLPLANLEVLE